MTYVELIYIFIIVMIKCIDCNEEFKPITINQVRCTACWELYVRAKVELLKERSEKQSLNLNKVKWPTLTTQPLQILDCV